MSGFDFSALPPVSTFEYHPANYQVMQQKLNLIKMQQLLGSIKPETKPLLHQNNIYNYKNNIKKYEEPPINTRKENTDNTASFDFKPFFPNYNRHMSQSQIPQNNVVVNKISVNKQRQEESYESKNLSLLKLLNLPSNVKDFDKFLDTKTVVAGVDIVEN